MLASSFELSLRKRVLPGLVTAGKYDGRHTCLTFVTTGSRVFIYAPHLRDQTGEEFVIINLQQEVTALGVVKGWTNSADEKEGGDRDVLVVGMRNSLLVYDVHENTDLFQIEVRDGVHSLAVGRFPPYSTPLIFVGGECAAHGFDPHGNDVYWAVAGDRVTKLGFTDAGRLLVGSEDGAVWVYEGDDVVQQLQVEDGGNVGTEDHMTGVCALTRRNDGDGENDNRKVQETMIAVAYGNSLVVFLTGRVLWKAVVGNGIRSIAGCDINDDGEEELVVAYLDGKLEARESSTGRVIFTMPSVSAEGKKTLGGDVAGMVHASFRNDSVMDIVLCSTSGEVHGFSVIPAHEMDTTALLEVQKSTLRQLNEEKERLLQRLSIQEPAITHGDATTSTSAKKLQENEILVPTVECKLEQNSDTKNETPFNVIVQLKKIPPGSDWEIRMVMLFGSGNFGDENGCIVVHSKPLDHLQTMNVPVYYDKTISVDFQIKVIYSTPSCPQLLATETRLTVPRYAIFRQMEELSFVSESWVAFKIEPLLCVQVYDWVFSRFLYQGGTKLSQHAQMELFTVNLINQMPLEVLLDNGEVSIRTDDISLAGDIVQDLSSYLNLSVLDVTAFFPKEMDALRKSIEVAKGLQIVRTKMQSENADRVILLKEQVLRAEDQRLLDDIAGMRESYSIIYGINRDLILEHAKRCKTQQQLTAELVAVNRVIQKAANLRVGKPKSVYMNRCRELLKSGDLSCLTL